MHSPLGLMRAWLGLPDSAGLLSRPPIRALTSLRFFAALCVVVLHATNHGLLPETWSYQWDFSKAVTFFFVLSGFVLTYAYEGRHYKINSFYKARFARVWPAAALSIILVPIILPATSYLPSQPDLQGISLLVSLAGLQAWLPTPELFFAFNAVTWTISVEFVFYALFPFLQRGLYRWPCLTLFSTLTLGLLLAAFAVWWQLPSFADDRLTQPVWEGLVYINPLARLAEFLFGMLAGRLYLNLNFSRLIGRWQEWATRHPLISSLVELIAPTILLFLCFSGFLIEWDKVSFLREPFSLLFNQWLTGLGFAVFLICISASRGRLCQFLCWTPLVMLGEVSYGIYLFHQPLMIRAAQINGIVLGGIQLLPASFLPVLAWVLLVSAVSWRCVERPLQGLLKKTL